ncbi:MAG: helix-turn-helix domain-containing protein [Capsulimonadaceae bacterium]
MELGKRIREARRRAGFSLAELRERTGIGESSLSEFENDKREPSLSQLGRIADACYQHIAFMLTDDLPEDETVLWRNRPAEGATAKEAEFKELARNYCLLEKWCREVIQPYLPFPRVNPDTYSEYDATELARRVRQDLDLGGRPAFDLLRVLENDCGVKVFHRDLGRSRTAACLKSAGCGIAVLLNAGNSRFVRNFDLAQQLFHLLTWDTFRTRTSIASTDEEKFAQAFASQLLMPEDAVRSVLGRSARGETLFASDVPDLARQFDVTVEAIVWRMHHVYGWGAANTVRTNQLIEDVARFVTEGDGIEDNAPARLPDRYKALAVKALSRGEVSTSRFAKMMGIDLWEAMQYRQQEDAFGAEIRLIAA